MSPHRASGRQGPAPGVDLGAAAAALVPLLSDYLDEVAHRAALRFAPVAGVAVTLSIDGEPWTGGASNTLAAEVDRIQYEVGVGPCLVALRQGASTYVPDLAGDDRWADYGPPRAGRLAASPYRCCSTTVPPPCSRSTVTAWTHCPRTRGRRCRT